MKMDTCQANLKDVIDLLNQRLGSNFGITVAEIKAVREMVANKEVAGQLALTAGNGARRGLLETRVLWETYPVIYAPKDSPMKINALEDLKGKAVSTLKGSRYAEKILAPYQDKIDIVRTDTIVEAFKLLYEGKVDYMIGLTSQAYYLTKMRFLTLEPAFVMTDRPTKIVMGVRDDWPKLVEILNKGLKSITEDEWVTINDKWLGIPGVIRPQLSLTLEEKAWIDQNHKIRVRVANWPPYLIIKENDPPQGIAIEYLKLVEERTGLKFEYEMAKQSFAEFLESIKLHQGPDMTPLIAQSPDREQYLSFTTPYISSPYVIFARQQEGVLIDINGLSGKTLAVPKGFIIQQFLEKDYPEIRLVLFENDEQSLLALSSGKVDAYIGNLTVASHLIQKRGLSNLQVVAPTPYGDHVLSMGHRNDWPELTTMIDKALASITEAEKTAIRNKYVALRYEQGVDRADVVKWILIVVGGALGIVVIFVFWTRSLGRKVNQRTRALQQEIGVRKQTEDDLRKYQMRLKALASQLTFAEEKERQRIAIELHDQVGQSLAFARMRLATAKKNTGNDKLQDILNDASASILQAVQDTRHVIFDLSSPAMREIGLRAAIAEWLEEEVQHRHGLQTAFVDKVNPERKIVLPNDIRAMLFRNVRELLMNAVKHAQAQKITVYTENTSNDLVIVVEDDGVGFDADTITETSKMKDSFGLFSIQERMADLDGALEIASQPGKGCRATLRVPLKLGEE